MGARTYLRKPAWRGALVGLICAVAVCFITQLNVIKALEEWMLDGCFSIRGRRESTARIVIVGLDNASLDELRNPPADISPELAEVVAYVRWQGAVAVGIDLLVPESLSGRADMQRGRPGDATRLGQAIMDTGGVVLPINGTGDGWERPLLQWQWRSLMEPHAGDFGFLNLTEDGDCLVRRQQLAALCDESLQVHFSLALHCRAHGLAYEWDDGLRVGNAKLPLDDEQRMRINFVGPPGTFEVIPFRTMLGAARARDAPPVDLTDAIVIIGSTASSHQDQHATPYANDYSSWLLPKACSLMSGPEVHANILATMEDNAYLTTPIWLETWFVLLTLGPLLGVLYVRLNPAWGAVAALVHHFAWKFFCLTAFVHWNVRVEMLGMLLLGLSAYGATFALRWRQLRRTLRVVKSEAVAESLEADPRQLELRAEERVVTVLFADVRDFTAYAENRSPTQVAGLLNAYFSAMVPLVEEHSGTINTFMGDGMMVLFGAPLTCDNHALQAVRAATAMVRRVEELRCIWTKFGYPELRIGVGIHTGKVVVGTMGSRKRLDYTAVGDVVNAAARIEAVNKELGTDVLISEATFRLLPLLERNLSGCDERPLQSPVKGKQKSMRLHAVYGSCNSLLRHQLGSIKGAKSAKLIEGVN
jgi:adenylate cyclase